MITLTHVMESGFVIKEADVKSFIQTYDPNNPKRLPANRLAYFLDFSMLGSCRQCMTVEHNGEFKAMIVPREGKKETVEAWFQQFKVPFEYVTIDNPLQKLYPISYVEHLVDDV